VSLIALLFALSCGLCCYLASANGRWQWLLAKRQWAMAALVLGGIAMAAWVRVLGPVAGLCAWLTALMLAWAALPYIALARTNVSGTDR